MSKTIAYACPAKIENGSRCRKNAIESSSNYYCEQHEKMHLAGKHVDKVGPADLTLVRCNVSDDWNHEWVQTLLSLGVPKVADQSAEQKDAEHAKHAAEFRRKAGAYGRIDSGVAVFGKNGLADVCLEQMFSDLRGVYGGVSSLHLTTGRKQNPVLEIAFSKSEPAIQIAPAVMSSLFEYIGLASFGYCTVYSNPPKEGKGIVDTVNVDFRQEIGRGVQTLRHAGGEWANEPIN